MTRARLASPVSLALVAAVPVASSGDAPPARSEPALRIVARLAPDMHRIEATASMDLETTGPNEPAFELNGGIVVREVRMDGKDVPIRVTPPAAKGGKARVTIEPPARPGMHRCEVRYEGSIFDPPSVAQFSRDRIADQSEGTIQGEGVFLSPSSGWYPRSPSSSATGIARVEVTLPPGWEAITEGSLKSREETPEGTLTVFEGTLPKDGLDLVAGAWKRIERDHRGIKVAAYVFPDDTDLAEPYLRAVERYLDMYSEWIGPYAYDRFTVVENFFPTGYGMPGFTLLGREVMRLPFIVGTSLGHEVAHNWWGNGVFVDESGGNWCEGLTTYVADYHYKELESPEAAAEYRREAARDFTNYVGVPGRDFPLTGFTERSTPATRAIGYGKSMMVFHMIERRIGKERFDAALRRVYRERLHGVASWDTWREAFSKEAGQDLGAFFDAWVKRAGAPRLTLDRATVTEDRSGGGSRFEVTGRIAQDGGIWPVRVPLELEGGGKVERRVVDVTKEAAEFEVTTPFRPEILRVDPDQDVFRRLDPAEIPPVLSLLLGDPTTLFVVDDTVAAETVGAYREMAATLTRTGEGRVADASSLKADALAGRSVLFLGVPSGEPFAPLLAGLPKEVGIAPKRLSVQGSEYGQEGAALLAVGRKPGDPSRGVGAFVGLSPGAIRAAGRKLVHYGKYSFLAFVDGNNVAKGVAGIDGGPLVLRFEKTAE